ncbi:MAG: 30S ribosomal protein S18 [Chloroflexi bacterium]|nr:30S ribosomal protein S18 [Chloroflexota bacterium]
MSMERPRRREGGRKFFPRRRACQFCVDRKVVIDYRNVDMLRRYLSDGIKIDPRKRSGTCARHQRVLARAIKRARQVALLPLAPEHIRQIVRT